MAEFNDPEIEELRQICEAEFNERVSREQALDIAERLIALCKIVGQALPDEVNQAETARAVDNPLST